MIVCPKARHLCGIANDSLFVLFVSTLVIKKAREAAGGEAKQSPPTANRCFLPCRDNSLIPFTTEAAVIQSSAMRVPLSVQSLSFWFTLLIAFSLAVPLSSAHAAITATGTVTPSNPSSWTLSTNAGIGGMSSGTLTVDGDSDLLSGYAYIGCGTAAGTGLVTVDGSGSTWTNSGYIQLGGSPDYGGSQGTLSIKNGGVVNCGRIDMGDGNSAKGVVKVDGIGSALICSGSLTVGNDGSGSISISNGASLRSGYSIINSILGSGTSVSVNGAGSSWICSNNIILGGTNPVSLSISGGTVITTGISAYSNYSEIEVNSSSLLEINIGNTSLTGGKGSISLYSNTA
jgi:T5SS/PEP-CTERM-associated repeat protein